MRLRDVIICMIFLVLAVAAGLTAFNEWGEADQPDYEYLDMVPLSTFGDPDAVSGCCEVVTYLGEPYVRMTDVGEIHVVKGSEVTSYTVGKAQLDLFFRLVEIVFNLLTFSMDGYGLSGTAAILCSVFFSVSFYTSLIAICAEHLHLLILMTALVGVLQGIAIFG